MTKWLTMRPWDAKNQGVCAAHLPQSIHAQATMLFNQHVEQWNTIGRLSPKSLCENTYTFNGAATSVHPKPQTQFFTSSQHPEAQGNPDMDDWVLATRVAQRFNIYKGGSSWVRQPLPEASSVLRVTLHWQNKGADQFLAWLTDTLGRTDPATQQLLESLEPAAIAACNAYRAKLELCA